MKLLNLILFILITKMIFSNEITKEQIIQAFNKDDTKYVEFLGKNINRKDSLNKTPLHRAVECGKFNITKALILKGAKVNAKDYILYTPLHYACGMKSENPSKYFKIAKLLIENGANVNLTAGKSAISGDKLKQTPLHFAVKNNNFNRIKLLVENGANVNAKDYEKVVPLYLAARQGNKGIIEYLISKNADLEIQDSYYKCTPLLASIPHTAYNFEATKLLIKNGANVNVKDRNGETSLHLAARKKDNRLITMLIAYGAKINAKNNNGNMPIDEAKRMNRVANIVILQKAETPEVQALIKEGKKEEVIKILTEAAEKISKDTHS